MSTENEEVSKLFEFNYGSSGGGGGCRKATYPLTLPLPSCVTVRELGYRIIETNKVPLMYEEEVICKLKDFVDNETEKVRNKRFAEAQAKFYKNYNNQSVTELKVKMEKIMRIATSPIESPVKKESSELVTGETTFSEMYHELIHSGFLTELLVSLEIAYSIPVTLLISGRDKELTELSQYQAEEMETMLKRVGVGVKDEDINKLSARHFYDAESLQQRWQQKLENLKKSQKAEYEHLVQMLYDCYLAGEKESLIATLKSKIESITYEEQDKSDDWERVDYRDATLMEESFTINLGSQLKTTHNLKLSSKNVLDVCRGYPGSHFQPTPQRIQTAMSLYSNSLSGIVLLVDNRVNSYTGFKKEFAKICSQSTELHFPDLESQQEKIRSLRNKMDNSKFDASSAILKTGDFYVTKHSNLTDVHVAFHLVSDDSVLSPDLNSRHPVILGLRNILKAAHLNDITFLSLPLLLIQELPDDITMQWCLKRAELVLKCVKGFMIEMASLSPTSDDNKTLEFIVPKGITKELFASLASMLSGIFRLANPLVLK